MNARDGAKDQKQRTGHHIEKKKPTGNALHVMMQLVAKFGYRQQEPDSRFRKIYCPPLAAANVWATTFPISI